MYLLGENLGAFLLVLLLSRGFHRGLGKGFKGAWLAFAITTISTTVLASWGFSTAEMGFFEVMPRIALTYGKFALAFLIVDLEAARRQRVTSQPAGLSITLAWTGAAAIVAAGIFISALPGLRRSAVAAAPPTPTSAQQQAQEWSVLTSEESRFKAWVPGPAKVSTQTVPGVKGRPPSEIRTFESTAGEAFFNISHVHYTDAHIDPSATVERVLESSRDGILKSTNATLRSERWLSHEGWPALEMAAAAKEEGQLVDLVSRMIVVGRDVYVLAAVQVASPKDTERFFFNFSPMKPVDDFRLPRRGTQQKPRKPTRKEAKEIDERLKRMGY